MYCLLLSPRGTPAHSAAQGLWGLGPPAPFGEEVCLADSIAQLYFTLSFLPCYITKKNMLTHERKDKRPQPFNDTRDLLSFL